MDTLDYLCCAFFLGKKSDALNGPHTTGLLWSTRTKQPTYTQSGVTHTFFNCLFKSCEEPTNVYLLKMGRKGQNSQVVDTDLLLYYTTAPIFPDRNCPVKMPAMPVFFYLLVRMKGSTCRGLKRCSDKQCGCLRDLFSLVCVAMNGKFMGPGCSSVYMLSFNLRASPQKHCALCSAVSQYIKKKVSKTSFSFQSLTLPSFRL